MKSKILSALAALFLVVAPAAAHADPTDAASSAAAPNGGAVDPALTQVVDPNETVAPLGTPVSISAGHADLGPKFVDGKWTFLVRDDTSAKPVWRHLEDVVFVVSDKAKTRIPEGDKNYSFIHANGPVWVIPQTEMQDVVWLGWNTQDPEVVKRLQAGVSMVYAGHQGPGDLNVFVQAGNFAGPQELWNSTKHVSQPIHVDANTHTHANWVFTQPGVHLVRMTVQGQLADGTKVEDTKILRFAVGSGTDPQKALETQWTTQNTPESTANVSEPSAVDRSTNVPLYVGIGLVAVAIVAVGAIVASRARNRKLHAAAQRAVEGEERGDDEAAGAVSGGSASAAQESADSASEGGAK